MAQRLPSLGLENVFKSGKKREPSTRPDGRPEGCSPLVTGHSLSRRSPPNGRPKIWGPGRSQHNSRIIATANPDTLRSAGRLAEFDLLLERANVDICGIQETRWPEDTTVLQPNYQFIFSKATPTGQGGVGVAIRRPLQNCVMAVELIGPRLMWVRLRGAARHLSIIIAYSPTNAEDTTEESRDAFYASLHRAWANCCRKDVRIILMDANTTAGTNRQLAPLGVGPFGCPLPEYSPLPENTPNGLRFLEFLNSTGCADGATWFRKPAYKKQTFFSTAELSPPKDLDHILIAGSDKNCLRDSYVRHYIHISTTCVPRRTDSKLPGHRLLIGKLQIRLSTRFQVHKGFTV